MKHYFVLKSFSGALGRFEAGTLAAFEAGPARVLYEDKLITLPSSAEHQAWLAAHGQPAPAPAAEAPSDAPETPAETPAEAETNPAPEAVIETKPAPARKASKKAAQ